MYSKQLLNQSLNQVVLIAIFNNRKSLGWGFWLNCAWMVLLHKKDISLLIALMPKTIYSLNCVAQRKDSCFPSSYPGLLSRLCRYVFSFPYCIVCEQHWDWTHLQQKIYILNRSLGPGTVIPGNSSRKHGWVIKTFLPPGHLATRYSLQSILTNLTYTLQM